MSEISDAAFDFQDGMEKGDVKMVVVNAYVDDDESDELEILRISHEVEARQKQRLAATKRDRDADAAVMVSARLAHPLRC